MQVRRNGEGEEPGPPLPPRINRLYELAQNLWWSWHENGRQVFRSLDYGLWRATGHNPVEQLRAISPEKSQQAATDPTFLELYDCVMAELDDDTRGEKTWFNQTYPGFFPAPVAYFSAEFAIHGSLPIYAGGLGVLAGDTCKEASDLGLPLVAVGFMYPQGYFQQRMSAEGWQKEAYTELNFVAAPISRCPWPKACPPTVSVQLGDRRLHASAWLVQVGRVNLYLLDTNVEENAIPDRSLSARLYTADVEQRLQQAVVLGVCGVRLLRALGYKPCVWHGNEDLTVFMMLERLREEVERGATIEQALSAVRTSSVFTTHTPMPAGHTIIPVHLADRYLRTFWESLGLDRDAFLSLGQHGGLDASGYSLTALALRLAGQANAVSRLHGEVARRMWHVLWPDRPESEVPITHVTNGVHLPTWQAVEMVNLCAKYRGNGRMGLQDEPETWRCLGEVPDEEFWEVRKLLKTRLMRNIQERIQKRWVNDAILNKQAIAMGAMLEPDALTIAFTRRFAEYKRPSLILADPDRLRKIVNDPTRPVQVIFAGKSHPADLPAKHLLSQVYQAALDRSFQGRVAFVEDFDVHLARDMVRGADVWLNNPRRLREASGTSGMKAAVNGAINISVRDGWWAEAYNGSNGWAIGGTQAMEPHEEDRSDTEALYQLLENEVVPLYYDRDRRGVPHRWIKMAKESIRSIAPMFSASRMMKEYTGKMYLQPFTIGAAGMEDARRRQQ